MDTEDRIQEALANPQNMGEMADADSVGTVGNPDCGDMLRMWLKFKEDENGEKLIDKASFQSFGCQTAIAVASVATEMLRGKPVREALDLKADELSSPLGPLPPMKIHCGQMVEGALRDALQAESVEPTESGEAPESAEPSSQEQTPAAATLAQSLADSAAPKGGKIRIVKVD